MFKNNNEDDDDDNILSSSPKKGRIPSPGILLKPNCIQQSGERILFESFQISHRYRL